MSQKIEDRPAVQVLFREVDPRKPASPHAYNFPRLVYIPDGSSVLIGTSASEMAKRLEEIFDWTEWPQLNGSDRYSRGGLIIGLSDFGTYHPQVPTLDNVTIQALKLVSFVKTYKLKLNIHGLDGFEENPISHPGNTGTFAKVDIVCHGPSISDHLQGMREVLFADYGLSFYVTPGAEVRNPRVALTASNGYGRRAVNNTQPIAEILLIDNVADSLRFRAYQLDQVSVS